MASGNHSKAKDKPPVLPIKQRRYYSADSDHVIHSPIGHWQQNYENSDVFPEPTDCHAANCPIHQRYDPLQTPGDIFLTPPPVPKKKFVRSLSLPGTITPSVSPFSPLERYPQCFDNPIYMMAPTPDPCCHEKTQNITKNPSKSCVLTTKMNISPTTSATS